MRITTCETRIQLIVYSVSLCAVSIFCDASVALGFSFFLPSHYCFFLVSFQRAVLEARSTMPMLPPCCQVGLIA